MEKYTSSEMKRFNYLLGETEAAYHEVSLRLGLSDSAMKILYAICDRGEPCLLQEICHCSGLSKQTVNSAIRKLESADILRLEQAGAKSKRVCLTETGKTLAGQTVRRVIRIENEIFASWPKEDVETYLALTERFLTGLKAKTSEL